MRRALPPLATRDTAEGAAAFAEFYLESPNYLLQNPELGVLDAYAIPECTSCDVFEARIASLERYDYYQDAPLGAIQKAQVVEDGDAYFVEVSVETMTHWVLTSDGTVTETIGAAGDLDLEFELAHDGTVFAIQEVVTIE